MSANADLVVPEPPIPEVPKRPRAARARGILSVVLFVLAGIVLFVGNVGFWLRETIYDTDGFVDTVDGVFQQEEVQERIALRLTNQLLIRVDLQSRLDEGLPPALGLLSGPLAARLHELVYDFTLQFVQSDRFQDAYRAALTQTHSQLMAILDNEDVVQVADNNTVLVDLRPVLREIVESLGLSDTDLAQRLQNTDLNVQLPDEAGVIVVKSRTAARSLEAARTLDDLFVAIVIIAAVLLVLAVAVAAYRRKALLRAGITLLVVGLVSLLILLPARIFAGSIAEDPGAVRDLLQTITEQFRWQSFVLIVIGALLALAALLAGGSALAVALRSRFRGRPSQDISLEAAVRDQGAGLRLAGIATALVLLLVWPDPSTRTQVTILVLLALYLAGIWAITSNNSLATRMRGSFSGSWNAHVQRSGEGSWLARYSTPLRALGVLAAAVAIILLPGITLPIIIAIVALTLGYLALLDLAAARVAS